MMANCLYRIWQQNFIEFTTAECVICNISGIRVNLYKSLNIWAFN